MKLNNKVYDILKWIDILLLPAIGALYAGLAKVWGWPLSGEVTSTMDYICVFLGVILGISTANYNKTK